MTSTECMRHCICLDCRANEVVCDSSGRPRADTGGGATRRLFMQLPGVGAKTAKMWYDLGYRCAFSLPTGETRLVLHVPSSS